MSTFSEAEDRDASLPPGRAFVLQFGPAAGGQTDRFVGRIEHITSGRSARFASLEEAVGFITRVLAEPTTEHPKDRD